MRSVRVEKFRVQKKFHFRRELLQCLAMRVRCSPFHLLEVVVRIEKTAGLRAAVPLGKVFASVSYETCFDTRRSDRRTSDATLDEHSPLARAISLGSFPVNSTDINVAGERGRRHCLILKATPLSFVNLFRFCTVVIHEQVFDSCLYIS